MDKFTRNYSIILGIVIVGLLILFTYEDPKLTELNDMLQVDTALNAYPYNFRVVRLEKSVATMTTPRSPDFPAFRALGLLFPALENLPQDDPQLMQGQLVMAHTQEHAKALVLGSGHASHVVWELDTDWLARHGIDLERE